MSMVYMVIVGGGRGVGSPAHLCTSMSGIPIDHGSQILERSTISSNISEATTLSTQDSDAGPSRPEQGARGATAVDELANAEDGLGGERQQSILSGNSDEYDTLPDAREDKSIIRIKVRHDGVD